MKNRPFLSLLLSLLVVMAAALGAVQWEARHRYLLRGWTTAFPEPVADTPGATGTTMSRACVNAPLLSYADGELDWALDMIADGGFDWVRQSITWAEIEPADGVWAWERTDRVIEAATGRGLQVLVVLEKAPAWAGAPPDSGAFAEFASAVAARYGDRIAYYQVWHNPNLGDGWGGRANPFGYADLLARAAEAIRAVDPDARIVLGSLAATVEIGERNFAPDLFLSLLYEAGAAANFDVVAVQAYGFDSDPEDRRVAHEVLNFSNAILVRETLMAHGDGHKAIWASHFGWNSLRADWPGAPSIWGGVTADEQVTYTLGALARAEREWPWMGVMCVNGFQPRPAVETRPVLDAEEHWGFALVGPDGAPTALYAALQARRARQPVATPGVYRADTDLATFAGPWTLGPQGADMGEPTTVRPSVVLAFEGTGVALTVRRGPYRAFLFVTVDGEPAPALPRDRDGNAYVVLYDPFAAIATVPLAENLSPGVHTVEIVAERGWGQWALADWRVVSAPGNAASYRLGWGALGLLGLVGMGGVVWSASHMRWERWSAGVRRMQVRVTEWMAVGISFLTGAVTLFAAWQTLMSDSIFRRLGDHGDLVALILSTGLFYISPWLLLSLAAGSVLMFIVFLRPDLGMALTLFAAPLYAMDTHPLSYVGKSFSLTEIVLVPTVVGWGLRLFGAWGATRLGLGERGAALATRRWSAVRQRFTAIRAFMRPLLLFLLLGVISIFFVDYRREALRELRLVIVEPLLFFLVFTTLPPSPRGERRDRWRVVDALVASGLMVAVIGLVRYFFGQVITAEGGTRRLLSVYGSPNGVGLYLGRVLPILGAMVLWAGPRVAAAGGWRAQIGAWLRDLRHDGRRLFYLGAAVPMVAALALSLSRGAIVLGIPAAVVALGLLAGKPWRRITLMVLVIGVIALIPLLQTPRFQGMLDVSQGSTGFRLSLWFSSLQMLRDYPLLGVGLDNFLYVYRTRYVLPTAWEEFNLSLPHNMVLEFAVRLGLPGLAVMVWTQLLFWRAALPLRLREDRGIRALGIGVGAAMANVLAHGLVDAGYFLNDLAFVYMLLLGLAVWLKRQPFSTEEGPCA